MPSRKNWNKRSQQATAEHKFVHFRNISYGCSKESFAQLLSSQGYYNCIVYWPNKQKGDQYSHRGFCQVQFPDVAIAARAKTTFAGYSIAGRLMKTADIMPPPVCILPTAEILMPELHSLILYSPGKTEWRQDLNLYASQYHLLCIFAHATISFADTTYPGTTTCSHSSCIHICAKDPICTYYC
jgi:hypothetical protein